MNRDDIIRMAREAGIPLDPKHPGWLLPHLERFAKLVAAHTKQTCEAEIELQKQRAQIWRNEAYKLGGTPLPWDADEVIAKAVSAEREACARIVKKHLTLARFNERHLGLGDVRVTIADAEELDTAIRARGEG